MPALLFGAALTALLIRPAPADFSAYKFTPIARDEGTKRYPVWSPDGKSIAYSEDVHGVLQVFVKALGTDETAQLTHSASSCNRPFWSPDGANIYYNSDYSLWAVGAAGGVPDMVMENAAFPSAIHPDGKTVVFKRDGRTWVGSLKGGTPKVLSMIGGNVSSM